MDENGFESQHAGGRSPSVDEIFKLLTEEIKDINDKERLKGWTPWVILASMISASWIIVQDVWTGGHSWPRVVAVFILTTAVLKIICMAAKTLDDLATRRNKNTFQLLHSQASAVSILASSLWSSAIAWSCYLFQSHASKAIFVAAMAFYVIKTIFEFAITIVVSLRLPLPLSKPNRPIMFAAILGVFIATHVLMVFGVITSDVQSSIILIDIRIGSLLALTAYGITLLARLPDHSTLRESLTEIRRNLVLGETSIDETLHGARVALQGMWLSDIVRDETRILLGYISSVRGEYDDCLRQMKAIREAGALDANKRPSSDDLIALALPNILDVLKGYESRVMAIAGEYHELFSKVRNRLTILTKSCKIASNDLDRLVDEIKRAQTPVDQLQKQYIEEYYKLQNVWNAWFPEKKRDHKPFRKHQEVE